MRLLRSPITAGALALTSALVASCGGGGDSTTGPGKRSPAVARVALTPAALSLYEGQAAPVAATAYDARGGTVTASSVAWSVGDASVATVDAAGIVSARRAGTTTITARAGAIVGSADVTVRPVPVASVAVSPATLRLAVGEVAQITATPRDSAGSPLSGRSVTYGSSDSTVAGVSAGGVVTAVGPGSATIGVVSEGRRGSVTVTVVPVAVAGVTLTLNSATITAGQATQATATPRDAAGNVLSNRPAAFGTSDARVATVSAAGLVAGVAPGTATITATVEGQSASAQIIVTAPSPVASVSLTLNSAGITVGQSTQATATVRDAAGNVLGGRVVTYGSSMAGVAVVSPTGLVTGVAPGSATITASAEGRTAEALVTVAPAGLDRIVLGPATGWLARGVPYALRVTAYDVAGRIVTDRPITFTSSDATVATVSAAGVVSPLALGTVTIVAAADGRQASTTLSVVSTRRIGGTVTTLDGAAPTELLFSARTGVGTAARQEFTAAVDGATGQFTLDLPALPASAGPLELYLDAAAGTGRRYHPAYAQLGAGVVPAGAITVLLVPKIMVPDSGTYAGRRVPVSLDRAFTAVCTDTANSDCQSYWPSYWLAGIKMWPDAARPIPLAIDRTGAGATIGAADSTALWAIIRQMEASLGRRLYRPATFAAYTTPGYQSGTVLATLDPTLAANSGYTNWWWDAQGNMYQARVRFGSLAMFSRPGLVSHELTHAQGFSHTCAWPTVMGGYGCGSSSSLSESDVAYYHLAQLVRRRTAELRPTWGVREALAGERVLELGNLTLQAAPLALRSWSLLLPAAGSDSSRHGGSH